MKEIIYIQAGSVANHVGTHFWNTQESYFTYEEDEEPDVVHDVSFREGLNHKGEQTYCPRVLVFDRKSNFGALSQGLYDEDDTKEAKRDLVSWGGDVVEYRQGRIAKSMYHRQLDVAAEKEDVPGHDDDHEEEPRVLDEDVRFWSDYSRVFFHPRALQRLPNLADWESTEGDWTTGQETFERYEVGTDLMEDSFRLLVEDCDNLQGLQLMHDTSTFGAFADSFLTAFRDEFTKLPCLAFPLFSANIPPRLSLDFENDLALRKAVNDALVLAGLDGRATMSVPIQAPETWAGREWLDGVHLNRKSLYHTSALLSTHIESATLPLRLKDSTDDIASLSSALNWGGSLRFAHLSGAFPLSSPLRPDYDFERRLYDLSIPPLNSADRLDVLPEHARIYVTRGFSSFDRRQFDQWSEPRRPVPYSIYAPAYPLPTSFPAFLTSPPLPPPPASRTRTTSASHKPTPVTRTLTSLHSTPRTARLFGAYASLVDDVARVRTDLLEAMRVERDEVRELRDALWALRDGYAGVEDTVGEEEMDAQEFGEDED